MPIKLFNTYLEWRHLFALSILLILGYFLNIFYNQYIFAFYIIFIFWIVFHQPGCKQHLCNKTFINDDGFGYVDNFLNKNELDKYKQKFIKKYDSNTIFLGNPNTWGYLDEDTQILVENIKHKVEKLYNKTLFINYAFLRFYNPNAVNPFENFHLDSLHFNYDVIQIRSIVNLFDESDGTFSYKSKCCDNSTKNIPTKENTLVLIQANKLLHKYKFNKGYRCVLVIDFVDSKSKGIHGYFWSSFDFCWDRIQKFITSFN